MGQFFLDVRMYSYQSSARLGKNICATFFFRDFTSLIEAGIILANFDPNFVTPETTLKEKSGAETAPGWSRFHVHRMALI